jgi:hypothetical protein
VPNARVNSDQDDGSEEQAGIAGIRGEAGAPGSRCSKLIRHPSGSLLVSCAEKKRDSRRKGRSPSSFE